MYYANNRYGPRGFDFNNDFTGLIELAQGRQSTDNIRKLFGFHRDPNVRPETNDGAESLAYIDLQVLNLAPKYINRAVAKMQRLKYDISLESVDIVSMDEKTELGATIRAIYRLKEWVGQMGITLQQAFPDFDVSSLPEHPDELMYDIQTNPKLKKEIAGELGIKLIQAINNFNQKQRQTDWDLCVLGRAHLHCYPDENGVPRVDRVNPKFWGGAYVDNDDFEDQEYQFFIDCITVNQFIKEASGKMSQAEMEEIVQKYSTQNTTYVGNTSVDHTLQHIDNLNYIPVMRFYFLSEDTRNFVLTKNSYGNRIVFEKGHDYTEEKLKVRDKPDDKLVRNSYTSVYGGTWIIDSDVVYNYGRKEYPRTNLVNATLPIKTFATNFKDGRTVSFLSQMIEPLNMVNVAWNKIKEILAKGWMGIREINFAELENVAMGRGGNVWSPREVYDYFLKTNTLIKRGATNQYDQSNGPAIQDIPTGLLLADYFTALSTGINLLEQMTGTSAIEQAQIPDRLAVKNAQLSQMASDFDMEYLYNGHEYLYQRTSHQMLLLLQESLRSGKSIKGFIPALGKVNTGFYEVPQDIAYTEYGMMISKQPTPEEWVEFYNDIRIALQEGQITAADSAFIREIDNLKQARQILVIRQGIQERKLAQEAQRNNDMAMQANAQAAELKLSGELRLQQQKLDGEREKLRLDGLIKQQLQREKAELDAIANQQTNQTKRIISKQVSIDSIVEQAMKTSVEKKRIEAQMHKNSQAA